MLDVTMDAGVIAVPNPVRCAEDLHKYIDTLLDWSKLLDKPWVAIHMSERAAEALFADNLYPLRDQLRKLFDDHGIFQYDVNTVARVADKLLNLTPSFETFYRVKDVLAESISTEPNIIALTTHRGLQEDLERCVILLAILHKYCRHSLGGHSLILRSAPGTLVRVRAQICDVEHERDDLPHLSELPCEPEFFEGSILVCDDFTGLLGCLDEGAILREASNVQGVQLAIRIALFKDNLAQGRDPDWSELRIPAIGDDFAETCRGCCCDQGAGLAAKILRAVVETIENQNMGAVHALRTGKGGDNPPRMRGKDKAQRRDIDYEFHLHYWQCEDGSIELGSVVHHNDFSIPE